MKRRDPKPSLHLSKIEEAKSQRTMRKTTLMYVSLGADL